MTKGTVFVASPSAIGNRPEARGSSVPAWPAFFGVEAALDHPDGLGRGHAHALVESTTQPFTSPPLRSIALTLAPGPCPRP